MPTTIEPSLTFKDNLAQLPPVDGLARIDLAAPDGTVIATIENQPGQQGSLAVYHYLSQAFDVLGVNAAELGLALFGEHTADARNRPGAHPNIDRLIAIATGSNPLKIRVIAQGG